MKPHRGTLILVLGILSIVLTPCLSILGIPAWIMGNSDLKAIDADQMDASGRSLTSAGRICGMIGVILLILSILLAIALIGFGVLGALGSRR